MPKKTILIVDDSKVALLQERAVLEESGYECLTATDGEEGLELARRRHPDAIILDLMMPGLDGLECLARIRSDAELEGTPVIIVTADEDAARTRQGYRLGCSGYMTKPIDAEALVAILRTLPGC